MPSPVSTWMGDRCLSHVASHVYRQWTSLSYHAASVHPAMMGTWWNKKWTIVNGIICRKCAEFSPEEIRPYKREFQYQGCKLWCLLNFLGYQTINIHIYIYWPRGTLGQSCYWTGFCRVFFFHFFELSTLEQNLAIASFSNFLCLFSNNRRMADSTNRWPLRMTLMCDLDLSVLSPF